MPSRAGLHTLDIVDEKGTTMDKSKTELQEWVTNWYDTLASWQQVLRSGR